MAEAYPLSWPAGWPRTPVGAHQDGRGKFARATGGRASKTPITFSAARDSLHDALRRLGARDVVLSTNFTLNLQGEPHGGRGRPADEGIAVYFKRRGRNLVFAQDAYWRAEENMRSLAIALEALATLERHGGDKITERAFTGFAALAAPASCWEILELNKDTATSADVDQAFRAKSRRVHPDTATGDEEAFKRLTQARADALTALGGRR